MGVASTCSPMDMLEVPHSTTNPHRVGNGDHNSSLVGSMSAWGLDLDLDLDHLCRTGLLSVRLPCFGVDFGWTDRLRRFRTRLYFRGRHLGFRHVWLRLEPLADFAG